MQCPNCNSEKIVKKGKQINKFQEFQKFQCKSCNKYFTNNNIKNKTYDIKIILDSLNFYNQGYSLNTSAETINKKHKISISPQSIRNWLKEFEELCSFSRIREKALEYNNPKDMIVKRNFYHNQQPYLYQYHNSKIHFLRKYPKLKNYLLEIKDNCPNHLFNTNNRCSKENLNLNLKMRLKNNNACKLTSLVLKSIKDNRKRHQILQNFMLRNDTATIATEVPVYLKLNGKTITGHIDFLQLRFNKIHILDYKPEAEKEKHAQSQVYLYAKALSEITKIPLKYFVCAYFDEKNYFEFSPLEVFPSQKQMI